MFSNKASRMIRMKSSGWPFNNAFIELYDVVDRFFFSVNVKRVPRSIWTVLHYCMIIQIIKKVYSV